MAEVELTNKAKKVLSNLKGANRKYALMIAEKMAYCLGKHLFDYVPQCNKKALKGSIEGVHRLHVQRKYTVFYTIEGSSPNRHAKIKEIMGFEEAHQKYGYIL